MQASFALKLLGLSAFVGVISVPLCGALGLFLYIALDKVMYADDLATFMLFFLPYLVFGIPAVIAGSWFAVQRRRALLVAVLYGLTFLMGTLGFAGFWVGAMGI